MYAPAVLPGFLASAGAVPGAVAAPGASGTTISCGRVTLATWGVESSPGDPATFVLSRVLRDADGAVSERSIAASMRTDPRELVTLLPPFAAVTAGDDGVEMVADSMGFRQLFHTKPGAVGNGAMSTSALLAGWTTKAPLDEIAVGVQSLLGWQLGQRTLQAGVSKLAPGAVAALDADGVTVRDPGAEDDTPVDLRQAVVEAAAILRHSLEAVLDDHPGAVLQLTGGMDSRVLLAAVPPARRRDLRAMTLGDDDSGDVLIASRLAARDGIRHDVYRPAQLDDVSPREAWEASRSAAIRLDGMADPVTLAVLGYDERSFEQGVRISGLGGEVARGFYYLGKVQERPVTARDASRLASWRMFANESIEPGLLTEEFSAWAREAADGEVLEALTEGGSEWFHATDSLYLRHRMQRWAGATDTAVGSQRVVINPMLDARFLRLAQRMRPQDKADARFLASLLMELDPRLGAIPLEGRLAPAAYANPGPRQVVARNVLMGRKLARKAIQKVRGVNRAPEGVTVLADRVVAHWREHPEILAPLSGLGFIQDEWLDGVLAGGVRPRPSSVGFLTNVIVASDPLL